MRLTKPVHISRQLFILDSGFCVLRAIIELVKVGVYVAALVKKENIGQSMSQDNTHMEDKEVGDCDAIHGMMDGKPFYLFAMKELDYMMIFMSTYRTLLKMGETKHHGYNVGGQNVVKEFKYINVVRCTSIISINT